jgi:hypothetical protein
MTKQQPPPTTADDDDEGKKGKRRRIGVVMRAGEDRELEGVYERG